MANPVAHFAINADDVGRAQQFYSGVFGWTFQSWGPPGFYMIETGSAPMGSLQQRRELEPGVRMTGFECTISVPDVQAAKAAVEAHGGAVVMQPCTIPGVGHLFFFRDTEGNLAGAMQYDSAAE